MSHKPHAVVTGAAGFIGSNLSKGLIHRGWHVVGFDNFSTGKKTNISDLEASPGFTFIEGDIRDRASLKAAFRKADVVFHQAALGSVPRSVEDPWTTHENNVNGTLNALMAALSEKVDRFVYAASSSAYGDTDVLPKVENMPPKPLSPYAVSKHVGETYCSVFHHVYGLETISLRYFNVFGPHQDPDSQYAAVIPRFMSAIASGEQPVIYGDGEQTRDFTYIDNVVEANILAGTTDNREAFGKVFNIGCGDRYSINELFDYISEAFGSSVSPHYTEPRKGDVKDSQADISQAGKLLDYHPRIDLRTGLGLTAAWFKNNISSG